MPPSAARSRSRRQLRAHSAALLWLALVGTVATTGCGSGRTRASAASQRANLRADQRPVLIGRGSGFLLLPTSAAVARRAPVSGLRCGAARRAAFGVHLELYAERRVLIVPAGIGVAPPLRRRAAYVLGGRCVYPLRTLEPTGVIIVAQRRPATLGALFALWGQRLSGGALAGFRGPVTAYLDGRRWTGDPTTIPLRRHGEIVLEIGGEVLPHPGYGFPPGL